MVGAEKHSGVGTGEALPPLLARHSGCSTSPPSHGQVPCYFFAVAVCHLHIQTPASLFYLVNWRHLYENLFLKAQQEPGGFFDLDMQLHTFKIVSAGELIHLLPSLVSRTHPLAFANGPNSKDTDSVRREQILLQMLHHRGADPFLLQVQSSTAVGENLRQHEGCVVHDDCSDVAVDRVHSPRCTR